MRVVMMGTGPFAAPTFHALCASDHEVAALVTQPPRPVHRKKNAAPENPMRQLAQQHDVPILAPESINTEAARAALAERSPDLLVVCDYGQILSPETLTVAPLGGINLHGSLLPKYRGAAPVQWALLRGERETGNTVIHMTPALDAGPALAQCRTPILADDTAETLEARLAELGAPLVLEAISALARGKARPIPQQSSEMTKAPRLKKSDGLIDWTRSAAQIVNQVRALQPWPLAFTFWERPSGQPLRLILYRVAAHPSADASPPGTLVTTGPKLQVATAEGLLELVEVQPAGKRRMTAAELLRGNPLQSGERMIVQA